MAKNLVTLITDAVTELNTSIDMLKPIIDTQMLDTASGTWLDVLGLLVGCKPRVNGINNQYSLNDAQYRRLIRAKIEINQGGGTYESFANAVRYTMYLEDGLTWDDVKNLTVNVDVERAKIFLNVDKPTRGNVSALREFVPAGVRLWVFYKPDNFFGVDDLNSSHYPDTSIGGLSDLEDPSVVGGELAYFIN